MEDVASGERREAGPSAPREEAQESCDQSTQQVFPVLRRHKGNAQFSPMSEKPTEPFSRG